VIRKGRTMFRRRSSRSRAVRPARPAPVRARPVPRPAEPELRECGTCYGYGSVACRWCNETGDRDRSNDVDRDCNRCQGWGAMTCTACGGRGFR
jgi:hypothetical protein